MSAQLLSCLLAVAICFISVHADFVAYSIPNATDGHNERRLAHQYRQKGHNVPVDGFDWFAPWAGSDFLRKKHKPLKLDDGSTLIIYSVAVKTQNSLYMRNFHYYLDAMRNSYSAGLTGTTGSFTHCFVIPEILGNRSAHLLEAFTKSLPKGHSSVILNSAEVYPEKEFPYKLSRQVAYAASHLQLSSYSTFVVLDSTKIGPIYPHYWNETEFPMWTSVYTNSLSDEVRVVGRKLTCPTARAVAPVYAETITPLFEGPIGMDRAAFELASGVGFDVFSSKFVYLVLTSGYNVAALHGQPHGQDWRRWLKKPPLPPTHQYCSTTIPKIAEHPYEGLFVPRKGKLFAGFEKVYLSNLRSNHRQSLSASIVSEHNASKPMETDDRLLVVYAYYEKNAQYKSNLLHFLRTAVYPDAVKGDASLVDYVIIVNGDHTVKFPELNNLKVMLRNNSCLDFGSWGIGLMNRTKSHGHFFVLNASVKGPFLPSWYTAHWSRTMISRLTPERPVIGLSINCPDGVGRGVPHIMSMAMVFDRRAMELAEKKGLFSCVESYQVGLSRESDFSIALLEAGYNLGSMQEAQSLVDYRLLYRDYLNASMPHHSGCVGIDLDIFFKEGWYQGMSPHPLEFVFMKVSRYVNAPAIDFFSNIMMENSRDAVALPSAVLSVPEQPKRKKHLLLMMHSLDMDGAPRLLFEMGAMLIKMDYHVTFAAYTSGALETHIEQIGSSVYMMKQDSGMTLQSLLGSLYFNVDLVIFNTILWATMLHAQPQVRSNRPKYMWLLHENELSEENAIPTTKFWYGLDYPAIRTETKLRLTLQQPDTVTFVADKTRAIWSKFDHGHFETFRGFVLLDEVKKRAEKGLNPNTRPALLSAIGAKEGVFFLTVVGTVCERKGQLLLVQALEDVGMKIFADSGFVLLIIGAPSAVGGRGDSAYYNHVVSYVKGSKILRDRVKFIPFSDDALGYLALSSLHMSVSVAEAFPLNVLEAMALGIPVMVTPAGGSEEAFFNPDVDGFLLPCLVHDKVELGNFMLEKLRRPNKLVQLKTIGLAGQQVVFDRYTAKASQNRLEGLIQRSLYERERGPKGNVCVIVRTYAGHMSDPIFSLKNMLLSLIAQEYPHWTALVVNTDKKPMTGLYSTLAELSDHRIHVVDPPEKPKFEIGSFAPTDRVIHEQCPSDSDWLLVTNGDNYYSPNFLNHLDLKKDVIAYDFYSRYNHILDTRVVGRGCSRFFEIDSVACKQNLLKHWHTDLGSYVINYKRWMLEGRSFISMERDGDGTADGHTAESLVYYQWSVKMVERHADGCLFSHAPNMYYCLNNTYTSTALWNSETMECITDEQEKIELRKKFRPFHMDTLPYDQSLFQDRCMEPRPSIK